MRGPLRLLLSAPPFARDPLYRAAGQVPAFDLRFDRGSIVDVIGGITPTFTRPSSVQTVWTGAGFTGFAADVPAFAVDPATGRTGYVHNPAATNLFLNSASPATQSFTVTAQAYTLSFYGTGTIALSGVSTAGPLVGTGAAPNRVQLTFTPSAGTLTLTLSGSIVRPQLETGTVATSPISTAGSAVTRAADTMTVSGADFSRWYNQLGGVLYWEGGQSVTTGDVAFSYCLDNGAGAANTIYSDVSSGNRRGVVFVSSVVQCAANFGPASALAPMRTAFRVQADNFGLVANQGAVNTDTSGTLPPLSRLAIGNNFAGNANIANTLYRFAYFPPGPAQSRIQQMTL
jgi:hypothetical protein